MTAPTFPLFRALHLRARAAFDGGLSTAVETLGQELLDRPLSKAGFLSAALACARLLGYAVPWWAVAAPVAVILTLIGALVVYISCVIDRSDTHE